MTDTGERIRKIRSQKDMTQPQLARLTGIPQSNLSDIERGKRDLTVSTLRVIAAALAVRPSVFLDEEDEPPTVRFELTRDRVERIAEAVINQTELIADEKIIADCLRMICPEAGVKRVSVRAAEEATAYLKRRLSGSEIKTLLAKVRDAELRHHAKKADR